jgi:hypothetical protein
MMGIACQEDFAAVIGGLIEVTCVDRVMDGRQRLKN